MKVYVSNKPEGQRKIYLRDFDAVEVATGGALATHVEIGPGTIWVTSTETPIEDYGDGSGYLCEMDELIEALAEIVKRRK